MSGATKHRRGLQQRQRRDCRRTYRYRYQMNSFVFGLEAQGDWADLKGSNTSTVFSGLTIPPGGALSLVTAARSTRSACSPVRSAMPGGRSSGTSKAARQSPITSMTHAHASFTRAAGGPPVFHPERDRSRLGGSLRRGYRKPALMSCSPGLVARRRIQSPVHGKQQVGFAYTGASGTGPIAGVKSQAGVPSRNESISGTSTWQPCGSTTASVAEARMAQ